MTTNQNRPRWGNSKGGTTRNGSHIKRSTNASGGQPVYRADGKVVIGQIFGNTFAKNAHGSKHMLQRPKGWAADTAVLIELHAHGVTTFKVTDRETGVVYTATLVDFDRYGVRVDRNFGPQICLPLPYWSVDGNPPAMTVARQPAAEQYTLW